MPHSKLTSREGVLKAIQEFDRLGREAFLAKYGFGKAKSFFLIHDGKRYDSKAIYGVAYGYEYPEEGPLTWRDFVGGKLLVQPELISRGFRVENIKIKKPTP